jgi:ABC-type polysaccharide/polyol phosphate export permease
VTGALKDLREVARDYAAYRDLLWQFVLRDVRIRYKQAVMGFLWALLMPLLLVAAGLLVRQALAAPSGGVISDAGSIAVRSVLWSTFAAAISFGTASLVGNSTLVGKIYFPREVLPMAAVLANAFDGAIAGAVVTAALPWLGATWSPAMLWVPVLLAVLFVLTAAAALALSAANLFYRDVKYLVQALLTVGVLFTPVFYVPADVGATAARVLAFNPLTPILEGMRLAVFEGHNLARPLAEGGIVVWSPWGLVYAAALAAGGLVAASVYFHRAEDVFAERI